MMFQSEGAGLLRPKRVWVALGVTLLALAPVFTVLSFFTHGATASFIFHCLLFGTMSLSYGARSTKGAKTDDGTLALTDDAITLNGRAIAKRSEVKQAFVVPQVGAPLVRLERHGRLTRSLFLRLRDDAEAQAFVRALGLDAARTAAEMRIASSMLAWSVMKQIAATVLPPLVLLPLAFAIRPILFAPAMLMYLVWVFGLAFSPTTVRVGTDGIVTRWLGRTRFIAHSEITRVFSYDEVRGTKRQRGVRLDLRSGEVVRLPTGQHDIAITDAAQLERRIDEARSAHTRGATHGTTDMLARGDRTLADWVHYLRGMGAGAVGPRTPAVPQDVLLRVVEDSKAAPLERASAAVAAIASGDDDAKRRVRVAADTTASPKLRIALERIATGEDEELVESLEELNAERGAS